MEQVAVRRRTPQAECRAFGAVREVQQAGGGMHHGTYTTAPSATISHVLSSQSAGSARIAPVALPL